MTFAEVIINAFVLLTAALSGALGGGVALLTWFALFGLVAAFCAALMIIERLAEFVIPRRGRA